MTHLEQLATTHVKEMVEKALLHTSGKILVIYDDEAPLTKIITAGYRNAFADAEIVRFDDLDKDDILSMFEALPKGSLVVQVQSSNFRLNDFRIRIVLFNLGLKAIEHVHLNRYPEEQFETYINSLHYDPDFFHTVGHGVKAKIDAAATCEVRCKEHRLYWKAGFEPAKLNIGDYRDMENVGGTFPIGEVFTESTDLKQVEGDALIYCFAGLDHQVKLYKPFVVHIEQGILRPGKDAPKEFLEIIDLIEETEPVYVREFGLGLNPAITKDHYLNDMTACERITGLHLSLGGKHSVYKKPGFNKRHGRYHIDVFIDADEILVDNQLLYKDWKYHV